jgi:hypothetical protein
MTTAPQALPDAPAMLITVASTDFSRQVGKLLSELAHGNVVRILDLQNREVRGYLTREVPESVRAVVDGEGPLPARLFADKHHTRRPEPAALAGLRVAQIAERYGVTLRTAEDWSAQARKELAAAGGHASHA